MMKSPDLKAMFKGVGIWFTPWIHFQGLSELFILPLRFGNDYDLAKYDTL